MIYKDRTSSSCDEIDCPERKMGEENCKELYMSYILKSLFLFREQVLTWGHFYYTAVR